jgi:hypothetical protein
MKTTLGFVCSSFLALSALAAERGATLPHTQPLTWEEADLSTRLMDGAHQFIERKIAEAAGKRAAFWARDFSSTAVVAKSVQPNRERLREIIGVVDSRLRASPALLTQHIAGRIRLSFHADFSLPMKIARTC